MVKTMPIMLSGTAILLLSFLCNLTFAQEVETVVGKIMSIDAVDKTAYISFKEGYKPAVGEMFLIYNEDKTVLTKLMVTEVLGKETAKAMVLTKETFAEIKLGNKVVKINHYELGMKYKKEGKYEGRLDSY